MKAIVVFVLVSTLICLNISCSTSGSMRVRGRDHNVLSIDSNPTEAKIYKAYNKDSLKGEDIDYLFVGETPHQIGLYGKENIYLLLKHPGYKDYRLVITRGEKDTSFEDSFEEDLWDAGPYAIFLIMAVGPLVLLDSLLEDSAEGKKLDRGETLMIQLEKLDKEESDE